MLSPLTGSDSEKNLSRIRVVKPRYEKTGRNRLSAESWLGGDNRLGRLNMWGGAAGLSGIVATLALLPE